MTKKKKENVVVETTKMVEKPKTEKPKWEVKDRLYMLTGNKQPLTLTIPSKHTRKHSLLYFDSEQQKQRELLQESQRR